MKTTISLDLSHTAVRLLADADPAETLGEVRLDDPDLGARIAAMRDALGMGPAPEVVVLIPHSEILFTTLDVAEGDPATERAEVRAALDGRTPYGLDELAFDWRRRADGTVAVAAVAHETLEEAEAFARAQGFTPLRLSSPSGDHAFEARPDFGAPRTGADTSGGPAPTDDVPPLADVPPLDDVPPMPDAPFPAEEDEARDTAPAFSTRRSAAPVPPPQGGESGLGGIAPRIGFAAREDSAGPAAGAPSDVRAGGPPGPGPRAPVPTIHRTDPDETPPPGGAPVDPPARGSRTALRATPLGLGLVAALLLLALVWAGLGLIGSDEAQRAEIPTTGEEIAATSAPVDEGAETEIPAPDELADGTAAPVDPLDRPADAPDSDRYAATGVEDAPPASPDAPSGEAAEGIFSGALDPELRRQDSVAEIENPVSETPRAPDAPAPPSESEAAGEIAPAAPTAPPAATPGAEDGIASAPEQDAAPDVVPDVAVTDGTPPVTPPAAPGRQQPVPDIPADAPEVEVPVNEGTPALRPAARPEERSAAPTLQGDTQVAGLAPDAPPDAGTAATTPNAARPPPRTAPDDAMPADPGLAEIAALAPRARPAMPATAPRALEDPEAVEDEALLAVSAAASAALAQLETTESARAVIASLQPRNRPADLGRPAPAQQPATPAATVAPRPTAPAPTPAPSGEIDLRRINLIGVYGTASNRRALVRLASGRFEKVSVGDRIDGGQITAIGADDLNYVKGGRSIVLRMTQG